MNKAYELEQLRQLLMSPELKSGLYLLDTELSDAEIESYIKQQGFSSYVKESLFPSSEGSAFELFVIGLSHQCHDMEIDGLRGQLFTAEGKRKEIIIYSMFIQMIQTLFPSERSVLQVVGEIDLSMICHEDLCLLNEALGHNDEVVLLISKNKGTFAQKCDPIINRISFKEQKKYAFMENRLDKVHISYKHDDEHKDALEAIKRGLDKNKILYSIDEYDILYRDNIEDYEKEIGLSGRVIMFVIPSYLKSLACMFEMTQMFKNGNVRERLFPVVDMKGIHRDGDGLKEIKDYWQNEKSRKSEQIKTEPGGSEFVIKEIQKIDEIINTMNKLWDFLVYENTGDYEKLIENDAALLMEELKRSLPQVSAPIDNKFVPSGDTKPTEYRTVNQYGEKSINLGVNNGTLIIS